MDVLQGAREVATSGAAAEGAQPATGGKVGLIGGVLAALATMVCWVGPLLLLSLGVGGAWMSNLTVLSPYRWELIGVALGFMGYAWDKIYRVQPAAGSGCEAEGVEPQTNRLLRVMFWVVFGLVLVALVSPYLLPLFY
jgi:mercuric ion transport protein